MGLKVRDRVKIIDTCGNFIAKGTIVNINDFREPNQKYAVDVDSFTDVLFFGESRLAKIEDFQVGDKVIHMKYGKGIVIANASNEYAEVYLVKYSNGNTLNSSAGLLVSS